MRWGDSAFLLMSFLWDHVFGACIFCGKPSFLCFELIYMSGNCGHEPDFDSLKGPKQNQTKTKGSYELSPGVPLDMRYDAFCRGLDHTEHEKTVWNGFVCSIVY